MNRILKSLLLVASLVAGAGATVVPVLAADAAVGLTQVADLQGKVVSLGLNKSMIIDLPEDIKDVLVSNPAIADVVVRTPRKIYLIGMSVGEANVFLFANGNRQLAQFELSVGRDTVALENTIAVSIPGSKIHAQSLGESLVLSGTATSAESVAMAANIAGKFIGSTDKVINTVTVAGSDQVNLRVVVAEVQRNTARQLGVDMGALATVGGVTFNPVSAPSAGISYNISHMWNNTIAHTGEDLFATTEQTANSTLGIGTSNFAAMIDALKTEGVMRSLAEPNLTAVSGQTAKFVVGGEIPYTTTSGDQTTTNFRDYGIQLQFTPVVLSSGRISLNINTEISDVDNTLTVNGAYALSKRQAQTTVELPSGGAIALGGLLKDNITKATSGTPGLTDVPILGALFKSESYKRQQTELVIFVTPYLVKPVDPQDMVRPDQNLNFQADAQGYFLHQINRIYRSNGAAANGAYNGRVGFSYE
jgi:pilus assembly protein CpaC